MLWKSVSLTVFIYHLENSTDWSRQGFFRTPDISDGNKIVFDNDFHKGSTSSDAMVIYKFSVQD